MLAQPHLVLIDIVEGGGELVVVLPVLRQIFDDEQLQLAQLLVGGAVVPGEGVHIVVTGGTAFEQRLHVGEECLLLVLHVTANLMGILVVETEYEARQRIVLVQ